MDEPETLERTKDAMPPDAAATMAERHKKHLARHLAAGHGLAVASALATQDCMAEDEAGETTPDAEDATDKEAGEKRNIPQSERDKMPAAEFAGPNKTFPIEKPEDITAAAHLIGKADNPDAVKAKIIAIAKKHGWVSSLPQAWQDELKGKSFDTRLRNGLKALGILKDEPDDVTAFKVFDNHYLCIWSNNFKDRDGEIFTEKAIDDYIARVDMGAVPLPELWVWHIPGTRIGQAEWVARHGHFVLSYGTFDDTPDGRAGKEYYSKHASEKGISHGYQYPQSRYDGKHYFSFNTFENSPLPLGAEANLYTSFEGVKAAKMDERKKQELERVFGKERAEQILANLDQRGKALEEIGVEFKDFVDPNADTTSANKEAVDLANKSLVELYPDLIEGQAETVGYLNTMTKEFKKVLADNAQMRKELDAMRAEFDQRPRASASKQTVIKEDDPLAKKSQAGLTAEQEALKDGPLAGLFSNG